MARRRAIDLVILFWLALGIPLSWKKGAVYNLDEEHRWIGIVYSSCPDGAVMRLPKEYVDELRELIKPLCKTNGVIHLHELDVIVGKAARVAHVVPAAKPFVAGLWGALAAAKRAATSMRKEAPPHHAATRRFCYSASWIAALLAEDGSCPLELERLVSPRAPKAASSSSWRVEFDASVYGGGAVLRNDEGLVVEYFSVLWTSWDAPHLGVVPGDCRHQTFFEFLTLLLALLVWGDWFVDESLAILGDNVGPLASALSRFSPSSLSRTGLETGSSEVVLRSRTPSF